MTSTLLEETIEAVVESPTAEAISLSQTDSLYSATLFTSGLTVHFPAESLGLIAPETTPSPETKCGFRAMFSRLFKREFWAKAKKMAPWFISGSILAIQLIVHAPIAVIGASFAALSIQVLKGIIKSNPFCQKLWSRLLAKAGMEDKDVPWIKISSIGIGSWLAAAAPSLAFLETAEEMVTGLFTQAAGAGGAGADVTTLVPLLFGVIRVVFIIYVLVAIVRVVVAFRNDEDWSTAARIPLIVVLCVVLGDALSALIAKGSKGAG